MPKISNKQSISSTKTPVVVVCAGGHARVLVDILCLQGIPIKGVTDLSAGQVNFGDKDIKYLGNDDYLDQVSPKDVLLVNGLGSVRDTSKRKKIFERFKIRGYQFATVIHPSAIISPNAVLEEGVQVMAGAIIQPGCMIGANTIINTGVSVDHDCQIGAHTHLAPGVVLSGAVHVGEGSHLGTGAIVVNNVTIPKHSFVKAATLVKKGTLTP